GASLEERLALVEAEATRTLEERALALARLKRRHDALTADAQRLAEGIKTLLHERESQTRQATTAKDAAAEATAGRSQAETRATQAEATVAALQQLLEEDRARVDALVRDGEEREQRSRAQ